MTALAAVLAITVAYAAGRALARRARPADDELVAWRRRHAALDAIYRRQEADL